MKSPPFSLAEAKKICAEYQHLVGQQFDPNHTSTIDCIAVAPFDQVNKSRFIIFYLLFEDADLALTNEYKGLLFDVIVIAGSSEKRELQHEDITAWLSKSKGPKEQKTDVAVHQNITGESR